jgi:general secretion pathway protein J
MTRQTGFTLLELLIAMTLMGLVLVMLYSGLRLGMRSWDIGELRAEKVNETRLVQEFIRRQLKQSMTVFRQDETEGRVVEFVGGEKTLTMVAPMLTYLGLGGLYVIQFDVVETDGTGYLRMRWHPYRPVITEADLTDEEDESTTLLAGVSDLQWSYFGAEQPDRDPDWYAQWENIQQRPLLVRLRVVLQEETWPELVAELPD